MDKFYILANAQKDENLEITEEIESYLKSQGKQVKIDTSEVISVKNIPEDTQCILVLGGDGTLIRVVRKTRKLNIPLIGVNLGTLGFLAEIELGRLEKTLCNLVKGEYQIEQLLKEHNISFEITEDAKEFLATRGFNPIYGARPLKRVIRQLVENPLSKEILAQRFTDGDCIKIDVQDDELVFRG